MSRWSEYTCTVKRPDVETLKLGDNVMAPIGCWFVAPAQKGTVVHIHPEKRFFTVQFENGIRESFCAHGYYS